MRRRDFVAAGALGVAAAALPREAFAATYVKPIGLQLYTVRTLMKAGVPGTLAHVAAAGYTEVETAGYFGIRARDFREMLDHAGLKAPSAHVPLETLTDRWPAALDEAATIGHRYIVVPSVDQAMRQSLDNWRTVAEQLNRAGAESAKYGITVGYHNHEYEFTPIDGVLPYDILLRATDPGRVVFELDLFWIRRGGQDALRYFRQWPGRFPMVHAKDMAADGAMVDVGAGVIDWHAIYAARNLAGLRHWFVEHDNPADPVASIRASRQYLAGVR